MKRFLFIKPILMGTFFLFMVTSQVVASNPQRDLRQVGSPNTNLETQSPFPKTPPDASLISVQNLNENGQAVVSGNPSAVPGEASVLIVNLSTMNVMTTTATSNGAFSVPIFAPPGSSLLVKYDVQHEFIDMFWQEAVNGLINAGGVVANPLPGTIIYHGEIPAASGDFESAGFLGGSESPEWAGWGLTASLEGPAGSGDFDLSAGDSITVTGSLRVYSPALDCTGTPTFSLPARLFVRDLFGADGRAHPWGAGFVSLLFTPTGLPIEHESAGQRYLLNETNISLSSCLDQHTAEGNLDFQVNLPLDLLDGSYQLEMTFQNGDIPLVPSTPSSLVWHHLEPKAAGPLLKVGTPDGPRIPWSLFVNDLSNGHRGVTAREDQGQAMMLTRVILPPHTTVLPMLDERSKEPITYHLEPGSPWLSSTDRRVPNPPRIPLQLPAGQLTAEIHKPDGSSAMLGPALIRQSWVRTPTVPDGGKLYEGTGNVGDIYQVYAGDQDLSFQFDQYGPHTIVLTGHLIDIYGNQYPINATYDLMVARQLDLDPAQLPTTPYGQYDHFAPGLHVFPPGPADIQIDLAHFPNSDPAQVVNDTITGKANPAGYFHAAGQAFSFDTPGEFRVDISASYQDPDGTLWAGYLTWGNVVEGANAEIEAHGRRGMDFEGNDLSGNPNWFVTRDVPPEKLGLEMYYPYFSGDVHWGDQTPGSGPGDSIHPIINFKDLTGINEKYYQILRNHFPRAFVRYRKPPVDYSLASLEKRIDIHEAPLFITTASGIDPAVTPEDIDLWGYTYATSERPDVHVREIIGEDSVGTAYWRFNDTYGYQIGEPADGDQEGDLKWEFGGVVFRVISETNPINQYAIYSSLWVLLPQGDPVGPRVTAPFQVTAGTINGGPIMNLLGEPINNLFLPKCVRPGDILETGDTIAFCGHAGPPLDSRVDVTISAPSGKTYTESWYANKIGWLYDPGFDFTADEPGRWTVEVLVEYDKEHLSYGLQVDGHNTGTVLGSHGQYSFYVVEADVPGLYISAPAPGFITWPNNQIEPISIQGIAPTGATAVYYTIHDKGIVMGQGSLAPGLDGRFTLIYDPEDLHQDFPMLSLTAREGRREGLADEVSINMLAVGSGQPRAAAITLIGEEIFVRSGPKPDRTQAIFLPLTQR